MPTQITNTASSTYSFGSGRVSSATSNVASTTLLAQYQIEATKTAQVSTYRAGDNVPYILELKNTGTSAVYNVSISDNLGGGGELDYVTGSAYIINNGVLTQVTPTSTSPLEITVIDEMPSESDIIVLYTARVDPNLASTIGDITNTVTLTAYETAGGTEISDLPTPTATITRESYALVQMTKVVSSSEIRVGVPFSFYITLENSGNIDATAIVITDILPANFTINSITSNTGGAITNFTSSDYTLDLPSNTLTMPSSSSSLTITVPSASSSSGNQTIVTITGQIS